MYPRDDVFVVQGFKAGAVSAGLKKKEGMLDLAVIFSEKEATVAGVFTANKVKAAPVLLSRERMAIGKARAIVANAGNANACTGEKGIEDARRTTRLVAEALGIRAEEVLAASTGVIGQPLQIDRIVRVIPDLIKGLSAENIPLAARAIMTTDSFSKISQFEGRAGGKTYRIQGIAKGAGMIMPDMATMLCFIISDISIGADELQNALLTCVQQSFNRISVDGDTSTNDTVLALANGMSGNEALSADDLHVFTKGLGQVMGELARMIVRDGEGATKLVDVVVKGAENPSDAIHAARTVANSSLVKTAFFGQDPNWGRIIAALGRSHIQMEEDQVDIWINDVQIVSAGLGKGVEAEKEAAFGMKQKEFTVTIDLHQGPCQDRVITCDLTHDYVSINADYRT